VPADDASRARWFYRAMFGWSFHAMEGPIEYHLAEVSEALGGAIHCVDQGGGIPGIFVYFDVNDINEGVQRVRVLGGSAEDPGAIPQKGWYARCSDTEGNQFGLWQNDPNAPMADGTPDA
jgi:uncharacterized protein